MCVDPQPAVYLLQMCTPQNLLSYFDILSFSPSKKCVEGQRNLKRFEIFAGCGVCVGNVCRKQCYEKGRDNGADHRQCITS